MTTRRESNATLVHLGVQLRAHRLHRGLTQGQVADAAMMARASIANIEAGRQEPGAETMILIADVLGVGLDELLWCPPGQQIPPALAELAQRLAAAEEVMVRAAQDAWVQGRYLDVLRHRAHADGLAQARQIADLVAGLARSPWPGSRCPEEDSNPQPAE